MGICNFFKKPTRPYEVVVHCNGRHPYLKETHLDYETRDVTFLVPARDWNDAAEQALAAARPLKHWSWWVLSIKRVDQ